MEALEALVQACRLYTQALELAPVPPDGIPSASRLDVLSNGGYALQSLAELVDDMGCAHMLDACQALVAQVVDADWLHLAMPAPLYMAAAHWFEQVARGQRLVLESSVQPAASMPTDVPAPLPPETEDEQSEFSSSLVAPASLVETWNDQIKCGVDVLAHAPDAAVLHSWVTSLQNLIQLAQSYVSALPEGFGESQSPPYAWARQVNLLQQASLEVQLAQVQRAVEWGVWPARQEWDALEDAILSQARAALQAPPPAQSLMSVRLGTDAEHIEALVEDLCTQAHHAHALARLRIDSLLRGDTDSAARAWELGACAAQCLLAAVAPFEAPESRAAPAPVAKNWSAWVPDTTPVPSTLNTSTQISRMRASMYGELSAVALTRAHTALAQALEVARSSQAKLLDHARIYARRALADDGLLWVHQVGVCPPSEDTLVYGRALTHALPEGGWESIVRDLTLLVGCARALWWRRAQGDSTAETELAALAGATWSLQHTSSTYRFAATQSALRTRLESDMELGCIAEEQFWAHVWWPCITAPRFAGMPCLA